VLSCVGSDLALGLIPCMTPWTSDQLVARPLPKHRTTQTQNKHIHTQNIHALCEIRTHDPGFRASEEITCPRPSGHRDRPQNTLLLWAVPQIRRRWPRFDPRSGNAEFVVDKVALGQVSPSVSVSSVNSHSITCFLFINHPVINSTESRY
jgi:hypothetical protein